MALQEQASRDNGVIDGAATQDEPEMLMMDVVGSISDVWAFFANGVDGGCRWHGYDRSLEDLGFRPYLSADGRYCAAGGNEEEEIRNLVCNMAECIVDYFACCLDDEDDERLSQDNLMLAAVLVPTLRNVIPQIERYLGIELDQIDVDGTEELREKLTADKTAKLSRALRCFACLFPQEADVRAASGDPYPADGGICRRREDGIPIHAGRLEGCLELDDEPDDEGTYYYRFKIMARQRYPPGHPLWTPSFLNH